MNHNCKVVLNHCCCCSVRAAASCIQIVGVWFSAQGDYYLGEKKPTGLIRIGKHWLRGKMAFILIIYLYCNSSQYITSTYNSHHKNNNNVVHYVFNPDHYVGIVIPNTTLLYKYKVSFEFKTEILIIQRHSENVSSILVGMTAIWNKGRDGIFSACPPPQTTSNKLLFCPSCCKLHSNSRCLIQNILVQRLLQKCP
jgi:hypothetical protein